MYSAPSHFKVPAEVTAFWRDSESLGMICDLDHWYITPDWAKKFQSHLEGILPIAAAGNPWAQYAVACIYMSGYLYSTQDDCIANHEQDAIEFSVWLEKCARQGFVAAVDNLITTGVGPEAERLREISRTIESQTSAPDDEQYIPVVPPGFFERVWQLAYAQNS